MFDPYSAGTPSTTSDYEYSRSRFPVRAGGGKPLNYLTLIDVGSGEGESRNTGTNGLAVTPPPPAPCETCSFRQQLSCANEKLVCPAFWVYAEGGSTSQQAKALRESALADDREPSRFLFDCLFIKCRKPGTWFNKRLQAKTDQRGSLVCP